MNRLWLRLFIGLLLLVAGAQAHPAYLTSALAKIERDGHFALALNFDVLAFALNDTPERVSDAAMNALLDGPRAELERRMTDAQRHFQRHFRVLADSREVAWERFGFPATDDVLAWKASERSPRLPVLMTVNVAGEIPSGSTRLAFQFPEIIGQVILTVERSGEEAYTEPVTAGGMSAELPLASRGTHAPEPAPTFFASLTRFIALGFEHILPRGLDHVLFVLGLFLLRGRLAALLWQVTAFTLAHSVTLGLSLYGVVELPSRIVEPLIALSIVLVAADNLRDRELRWWRVWVVFGFGLAHGLGFASALRELALPRSEFLRALIGFNLGVELGQLAVIVLAFLLVGWFRDHKFYRAWIVMPASICIGLVALGWTAQRLFW